MDESDLHWLAGLLEGEGSFLKPPPSNGNRIRISIQMTDVDVIERVCSLWGTKYYVSKPQKAHHKPGYVTGLGYAPAAEMMRRLRPLMGERRRQQIDAALALYDPDRALESRKARRKLSRRQVIEARARYQNGESGRALADEYSVFYTGFYAMLRRETYKDIA